MVAGFEILNEPMAGAAELYPFTERAAAAVRAAAPDKLIYFEPPAIRNFLDFQPLASSPFPVEGAVYAPHIYTYVFGPSQTPLENLTAEELRPSVDNANAEANAFATPMFIGEFGMGPDGTNADLWMATQGELHDEYFAGNAFWLWKEQSQGNWGLHDYDAAGDTWAERPQVVRWLSRFHPERMAGDPVSLDYDDATEVMRLELAARAGVTAPTTIYVPERHAGAYAITCDGAALTSPRDTATGLVELECAGVIEARPAP
jgi:endoglycosylceramidase